jgi:hypothetical protein
MRNFPTTAEINTLFANTDPDVVWAKAIDIVSRISPGYDLALARMVFDDVLRLFRGTFPGYGPIKTLYHDLPHTLDVFLCAVRLMHGVHVSGTPLTDDEITQVMIATMMHDIGYAQSLGDETGSGAQHTQSHVKRGIKFMRRYLIKRSYPSGFADRLEPMILCTEIALPFRQINFPDKRSCLLGQIVGTADLTGQMADRIYLEKLLFLYLEFKEANLGNFQSMHDLLRQTENFYVLTKKKLDEQFDGMYAKLTFHFKDTLGVESNYYMESIEKNIAYLSKVISLDESEYLSMFKRGGIVEKNQTLIAPPP